MNATPMSTTLMILLSQLAMSAPMLAVYVVGIVLAVLRRGRAPRAMTFAIAGLGLLFFATVAGAVGQAYFIGTGRAINAVWTIGMIGIGASMLRAMGMGLVVAAVFVGRERGIVGFEVAPATVAPPLAGLAPEHAVGS